MENTDSTTSSMPTTFSESFHINETLHVIEQQHHRPPSQFISSDDIYLPDVWVGLILILMVLVCIGYICTCVLYHKFRRWKQQVLEAQRMMQAHGSFLEDYAYEESLPSYTIVTGLPSYDQAMERFRQLRTMRRMSSPKLSDISEELNDPPKITFARLSLGEIFQFYKVDKNIPV
ncbi:hypothetical protein PGB90_007701 [Kerria lacca]